MSTSKGGVPSILVTDAGLGSAISIIRSLGRKGWRVVAADSDPGSLGFLSRYAAKHLLYPSPETSPREFIATLLHAACHGRIDLIIPVTDRVILPLSEARSQFDGICKLALPETGALEVVTNKLKTLQLAQRLGVPTPCTRLVSTAQESLEHSKTLTWPVVLKPQSSRVYRDRSAIETFRVTYAEDHERLVEQIQRFEGRCPVLLQEYYEGTGYGLELLTHQGRPLAAFQHKRLREIPVNGGVSTFRESVPLDPVLYRYAVRLLEGLEWTGLAMVEFKVGERGAKLMEINGRVWGSLPLALLSGMDFPGRLAELCLYGPPGPEMLPDTKYAIGVRARNLELDMLWIASVLSGKHRYPFLTTPGRRQGIIALLGLFNPADKFDIQSLDDPRPGLAEIPKIVHKLRAKLKQAKGEGRKASGLVKRTLSFAARSRTFSGFVTLLEQLDGERPNLLRVLTYHRIAWPSEKPALDPSLISATPVAFARQMEFLATNFHVVSVPELLEVQRTGIPLPPRSVMITFDDAYCDFAEHAWPIMKRHRLPVTLFVPTAFPDHPGRAFWWDRLYQAIRSAACRDCLDTPRGPFPIANQGQRDRAIKWLCSYVKTLPHGAAMFCVDDICSKLGVPNPEPSVLGWNALRQLASEGVTLGAHTQTHPVLSRVSPARALAEAVESLRDLHRKIGSAPPILAYPSGGFNDELVGLLKRAGFLLAFTTARGINDLNRTDWLRLRRINVGQRTTQSLLRAQLLAWCTHLNRWQRLPGA